MSSSAFHRGYVMLLLCRIMASVTYREVVVDGNVKRLVRWVVLANSSLFFFHSTWFFFFFATLSHIVLFFKALPCVLFVSSSFVNSFSPSSHLFVSLAVLH